LTYFLSPFNESLSEPARVTKGVFWDKWGPRIASCKKDLEYWHKLFDRTVNIEILHHVGDISTGIADMSNRMVRMENHVAEIHGSSKKGQFLSLFSPKVARAE
jgi:hypothetical protein